MSVDCSAFVISPNVSLISPSRAQVSCGVSHRLSAGLRERHRLSLSGAVQGTGQWLLLSLLVFIHTKHSIYLKVLWACFCKQAWHLVLKSLTSPAVSQKHLELLGAFTLIVMCCYKATKCHIWAIYVYCWFICSGSILRASFTNSLRQRKPSFGIKIVLSGFTKDAQWQISAEKAWTVIFALYLIEYAFVGVSLSDAKFMGGENSNESRNTFY